MGIMRRPICAECHRIEYSENWLSIWQQWAAPEAEARGREAAQLAGQLMAVQEEARRLEVHLETAREQLRAQEMAAVTARQEGAGLQSTVERLEAVRRGIGRLIEQC